MEEQTQKASGTPTGHSRFLLACCPPACSPVRTCTTCTASAPLTKWRSFPCCGRGWTPACMARWRRSAPASCSRASSKARWWASGHRRRDPDRRRAGRTGAAAGAGIVFPVANFAASLATGLVIGPAIGYVIIPARKFTINQSNSTYGADVMMGAGNSSGRFLGPLIILSAMTASIPIGIGSLLGALLFYIWGKPITGGAILGAMIRGDLPGSHFKRPAPGAVRCCGGARANRSNAVCMT